MNSSQVKTKWDLRRWYRGLADPAIGRDVQKIETACHRFARRWQKRTSTLARPAILARALVEYEKVLDLLAWSKPAHYLGLVRTLDGANTQAQALATRLALRLQEAGNRLIFFELALSHLTARQRARLLAARGLAPFRRFLERVFAWAPHRLTEPEEKILSLKAMPAHSLWVDSLEKMLQEQVVSFRGRPLPLAEAQATFSNLPTASRRALHEQLLAVYQSLAPAAEAELNAVVTNKKIDDQLHRFPRPEDETLLGYETDPQTLEALVAEVTRAYPLVHRFYEAKRKLLKLRYLTYADRAAAAGVIKKKIDFPRAVALFLRALGRLGPRLGPIFRRMLAAGQIDVYPQKGKSGGAFSSSAHRLPTVVMLNHVDTVDSYHVLAHELGHAFHSELSKRQRPLYQDYPISLAEVASTLFENFAYDELLSELDPREQAILLHNRVNDSVSTIFRQIACFGFECELHRQIRETGFLPKDQIAKLLNQHMSAYLGPAVRLDDRDGLFFVSWSHLRRFFYTYSYAYGELISRTLYARLRQDPSFWTEIERFLSAGSSLAPRDLWRSLGIDTTNPLFWRGGLARIDEELTKLENLT